MREYSIERSRQSSQIAYWKESVETTLFPLSIEFRSPAKFNGRLLAWDIGPVTLSHFLTDGIKYHREKRHVKEMTEEELLISFSLSSETSFAQSNVDLNFTKGQFVVQRGNYVYEFGHNNINELFVLKIQLDRLKRRVRSVERCFTHVFDARSGVGQLFLDSVRSLPETLLHTEEEHYWRLGNMIIDLAGIAIEADDRALLSRGTTIQQAHIGRIEKYIRQNIQNPNLGTERVAEACGISVRYLHELFGQTGRTVGSWIRQQRLEMAKQEICDVSRRETIAEVAYRWGFGDQAQFSRNYKSFFGESPRETRARTAKERDFSD